MQLMRALSSATTGTQNPFEQADRAQPGPPLDPGATIQVESGGDCWVVPAAVCLRGGDDSKVVLAEAQRQVAVVHSLIEPRISGWPSTTWDPSLTENAQAKLEQDLRIAGVTAMTLARLVDEQTALERAWMDYEQSFADAEQGWGPPAEISSRVESWRTEAQALAEAIASRCAKK